MYYISKLSKPSIDFVNKITATLGSRKEVFPIAVAYVLARNIAIPVEEVEDIEAYFRLHAQNEITFSLSELNEVLPFCYKTAMMTVVAFYKQRYEALHPRAIPLAFQKETAIVDFFGLSRYFSNELLKKIEDDPEALTTYISGLTTMLNEVAALKKASINQTTVEQDRYVAP